MVARRSRFDHATPFLNLLRVEKTTNYGRRKGSEKAENVEAYGLCSRSFIIASSQLDYRY